MARVGTCGVTDGGAFVAVVVVAVATAVIVVDARRAIGEARCGVLGACVALVWCYVLCVVRLRCVVGCTQVPLELTNK